MAPKQLLLTECAQNVHAPRNKAPLLGNHELKRRASWTICNFVELLVESRAFCHRLQATVQQRIGSFATKASRHFLHRARTQIRARPISTACARSICLQRNTQAVHVEICGHSFFFTLFLPPLLTLSKASVSSPLYRFFCPVTPLFIFLSFSPFELCFPSGPLQLMNIFVSSFTAISVRTFGQPPPMVFKIIRRVAGWLFR